MTEHHDDRAKVIELVGRAKSAMLTTITGNNELISRPMGVQDSEFDGDLWFFADSTSNKVQQIRANPSVNVSLANDDMSEWTSIRGAAEVVDDIAKSHQLWTKPLEAWFPDGPDTAGLILIKVHAQAAEYWDAANSRVRQLIGMARAIHRNDPDEFPVENRATKL